MVGWVFAKHSKLVKISNNIIFDKKNKRFHVQELFWISGNNDLKCSTRFFRPKIDFIVGPRFISGNITKIFIIKCSINFMQWSSTVLNKLEIRLEL